MFPSLQSEFLSHSTIPSKANFYPLKNNTEAKRRASGVRTNASRTQHSLDEMRNETGLQAITAVKIYSIKAIETSVVSDDFSSRLQLSNSSKLNHCKRRSNERSLKETILMDLGHSFDC